MMQLVGDSLTYTAQKYYQKNQYIANSVVLQQQHRHIFHFWQTSLPAQNRPEDIRQISAGGIFDVIDAIPHMFATYGGVHREV
jgi:hypothetical protein